MNQLRYTLISDGSSDRMLLPVLDWLLMQHSEEVFVPQWADLARLPRPPKGLRERLQVGLNQYPCELLFVHRDAEEKTWFVRRDEIQAALKGQDAVAAKTLDQFISWLARISGDAAMALQPLVGKHAAALFAFGLCNASLFAACILPLSTAFYICEGMGWESGVDNDFRQAPQFFWLFTVIIALSALVILIPNAPLIAIMYISQVVNGAVLPFVLIFMLRLINDKRIMGSYRNGPVFNTVAWITVIIMIILTLLMTFDLIFPGLFGRLIGR